MNHLQLDELGQLVRQAAFAKLLTDEYAIAGFILGFDQDAGYEGFNFNWFKQRYDNFLYIDRIVINPNYRGQALGKRLYQAAQQYCHNNNLSSLCCEVNEEPANPISHEFHSGFGFKAIDSVLHPEGKTVRMYQKLLQVA